MGGEAEEGVCRHVDSEGLEGRWEPGIRVEPDFGEVVVAYELRGSGSFGWWRRALV